MSRAWESFGRVSTFKRERSQLLRRRCDILHFAILCAPPFTSPLLRPLYVVILMVHLLQIPLADGLALSCTRPIFLQQVALTVPRPNETLGPHDWIVLAVMGYWLL